MSPQNGCDPNLRAKAEDSYGYRQRGDRCEGVYVQEVSASLWVASFTREPLQLAPQPDSLRLTWSPRDAEVHLRADALRPRVHYRMDAVRPVLSTGYVWNTSLLNFFRLEQKELGIVAWSQMRLGDTNRQLYVPVGVNEAKSGPPTAGEVILVPGAELRELYLTFALLKPDGTPADYIAKDKPLRYGYYPAQRGVPIELPPWKTPGIYLLEFGAELATGGVSSERIWFYGG
jgi:hypothetical protein